MPLENRIHEENSSAEFDRYGTGRLVYPFGLRLLRGSRNSTHAKEEAHRDFFGNALRLWKRECTCPRYMPGEARYKTEQQSFTEWSPRSLNLNILHLQDAKIGAIGEVFLITGASGQKPNPIAAPKAAIHEWNRANRTGA